MPIFKPNRLFLAILWRGSFHPLPMLACTKKVMIVFFRGKRSPFNSVTIYTISNLKSYTNEKKRNKLPILFSHFDEVVILLGVDGRFFSSLSVPIMEVCCPRVIDPTNHHVCSFHCSFCTHSPTNPTSKQYENILNTK